MAVKLTDDQISFLKGKTFGHVATINKDGSPQVSPIWVEWDGTHVVLNSEVKRLKVRNIKRDPRISISIQRENNPYNYVEIRGKVVEMTTEGAFEDIDKLAQKYFGQEKYPYNKPTDQRVILKIEPTRVVQPMG